MSYYYFYGLFLSIDMKHIIFNAEHLRKYSHINALVELLQYIWKCM